MVRMQSWPQNIFILKTFFAAFCRRMFHIILGSRMREPLRERRGRIFFSSKATLLWFSAEPEIWRRGRRRRSERRRLISIHSLREHSVIPSSSSEFQYTTNGRRPMAAAASSHPSRQFTLVYGCCKNVSRSAKKRKKAQSETGRPGRNRRSVSPTRANTSEMGRPCFSDSRTPLDNSPGNWGSGTGVLFTMHAQVEGRRDPRAWLSDAECVRLCIPRRSAGSDGGKASRSFARLGFDEACAHYGRPAS
jgi:hypothetical protein